MGRTKVLTPHCLVCCANGQACITGEYPAEVPATLRRHFEVVA
jgi:hypothetical protein